MKRATHILFGVGLTLFVLDPNAEDALLTVVSALLGSLTPDVDLRVGHRRTLHGLPSLLATSIGVYILAQHLSELGSPFLFALSYALSYASHLVLDGLTKRGIDALWPLRRGSYGLGVLRYDDPLANASLSVAGALLLLAWALGAYSLR
ncbi:MAG: metal-dependent hydrolase [Fervidicoccaceae archaeon]